MGQFSDFPPSPLGMTVADTAPKPEVVKRLCHSFCVDHKTYFLNAHCVNCSWKGQVERCKGYEFTQATCPQCECITLRRTI